MEKLPPRTNMVENTEVYVGWEEVYVCREKGKREIHYVLKRRDGGSALAVIAKEKSLRHMTYRFLLDFSSSLKPKSRREVVDWLNSFTPDSASPVSLLSGDSTDGSELDTLDVEKIKDIQLQKIGRHTRQFLWVGSQWTCKRRRKHYQAFCRNGVKISVNQFVHVLAEENKRLIAYLDDLYEDAKGNKMVVVRWFHMIDEVGIDLLPNNFNDREILFSLCLQDLSIECVDGLATVMSPPHYAKFLSEAKHTSLQPYMCCQQYDNNDLRPLDITQIKGYWKQDLVRYMLSFSSGRALQNRLLSDDSCRKEDFNTINENKPRKKIRLIRNRTLDVQCATVRGVVGAVDVLGPSNGGLAQGSGVAVFSKENMQAVGRYICLGSVVEVLSQDSGIRGCWFRATIIKMHKGKIKLCYNDLKDAEDEANCLKEWVLASRIAFNDEMGLRLNSRPAIRPFATHNGKVSWVINIGTIVDAWWHDGWWEGIVIQKEANEKFQVYFPGEKKQNLFSRSDLRHSLEWFEGTWKDLGERVDIAASLLSDIVKDGERSRKLCSDKHLQTLVFKHRHLNCDMGKCSSCGAKNDRNLLDTYSMFKKPNSLRFKKPNSSAVVDLLQDDCLSQLKWNPSRKRQRSGFVVQKLQSRRSYGISPEKKLSLEDRHNFLINSPLKEEKEHRASVNHDNCKYIDDSLFSPSVVPHLTSLVMSR